MDAVTCCQCGKRLMLKDSFHKFLKHQRTLVTVHTCSLDCLREWRSHNEDREKLPPIDNRRIIHFGFGGAEAS